MRYKGYDIVPERGHYVVLEDGNDIFRADTVTEAKMACDDLNDDKNAYAESLAYTGQWW